MKSKAVISIIALSLLFNISCSKKNNTDVAAFQFDKEATLIVNKFRDNKSHKVWTGYYSILPFNFIPGPVFADTLFPQNADRLILNFKITSPSTVDFVVDDNLRLPLFLVPGDTLYMTLNLSDSSKKAEPIRFEGKHASINEYQQNRYHKFKEVYEEKCAELLRANLPVKVMQYSIDSVSKIQMDYLNTYSKNNSLPGWYLNFEKNQITYIAAYNKIYYLGYRKFFNKIKESEPAHYYDFLKDIMIDNKDALSSPHYYHFLYYYFGHSIPEFLSMGGNDRIKNIHLKFLQVADSLLTGEAQDIFKSYIISNFLIGEGMYELAAAKINEQRNKTANIKYIKYLERCLESYSTIKAGNKAPGFLLPDTRDKVKSLFDYKGSVILINFWFPGCTGCQREIPFEEKLVNEFKNKKFHLINICFFSTKENWSKAINILGIKGINLFANENWQKKLAQDYKIIEYPHYSLIDKNGIIVSNNPRKPSEGLSEDIQKLLDN